MEQRLELILAAVDALAAPRNLILKNDAGVRQAEGLPAYVEAPRGSVERLEIQEGDARWQVPARKGQKTGWFYDQRDNRVRLAQLYRGARVLDLYSYAGGWSIQAARAGAAAVLAVDASDTAVTAVQDNAALNEVAGRVQAQRADVAQFLSQTDSRWDWVILDPPALVPRRKDLAKAQNHYRQLNRLALSRVVEDGVFVSCSCSALLDEAAHLALIRAAARQARVGLSLIGVAHCRRITPCIPCCPTVPI
jgi:23S rRNA (cytosine1962-C5)-methyltransferase